MRKLVFLMMLFISMAINAQNHWREFKLSSGFIQCDRCEREHHLDELWLVGFNNDTLYYFLPSKEKEFSENNLILLGNSLTLSHYCKIPEYSVFLGERLIKNSDLQEYIESWKDSLYNSSLTKDVATFYNIQQLAKFYKEISTKAPYGLIKNWGWELNSANGIEPNFTYFNCSKKTIKYIDFYFSLYNAVGDKCYLKYNNSYIGHVRGVGPVEYMDEATWNWDRATHYTSGDASEMKITKVVITYMDKTVKTLIGNNLKINY